MAVLLMSLNLHPHASRPFRDHIREFDFLGLALVVGGVVCVLIGFNNSEVSCTPHTMVLHLAHRC